MNLLRARRVLVLIAAALALSAPVAYALSSADLIKQGVQALKDGKPDKALDLFTQRGDQGNDGDDGKDGDRPAPSTTRRRAR